MELSLSTDEDGQTKRRRGEERRKAEKCSEWGEGKKKKMADTYRKGCEKREKRRGEIE